MCQVKVFYFAGVKDITNLEFQVIEISKEGTLSTLSKILISQYGSKFNDILMTSMYAVDMEYIDKEKEHETIIANREVAIIPPVSGG